MRKLIMSFAVAAIVPLALSTAPAFAQKAKASAPAAVPAQPDAEHIGAAAKVTDQLWPIGTMRRQMEGSMGKFYDGIFDEIMSSKMSDFVPENEIPKSQRNSANKTLMQMAEASDPYFKERMRITMEVTTKEMIPVMEKMEPDMRRIMTLAIARRYSPAQMADMNAFFATPSGQAFATTWLNLYMEPEVISVYKRMIPDFIKAGPDIAKKVEAATAHLPKPKMPANVTVDAADDAAAGAAAAAEDAAAGAMTESPWEDPANWAPADKAAYDAAEAEATAANDKMNALYEASAERAKARLSKKKK